MAAEKRHARGIKRSSLLKVQRQLTLLRCLGRGAMTSDDLIQAVNAMMPEAYPPAAREALRHDLRALREAFGCVIQHTAAGYQLMSVGELALLDLSAEDIAALRFLDSAYAGASPLPEHQQVRRLVARIVDLLPTERRGALNAGEPTLQLAGPQTPYPHDGATLRQLRKALAQRREIRFAYRPSLRPGEEAHRAAPVNLFTRDSHLYLLGYCYDGPHEMAERVGNYVDYRVDYIVPGSLAVLPRVLPPELPRRPMWTLQYELSADIARNRRIAHWFSDTQIEYRDNGTALVTATIHNLWQARQILLRYMDNCRVLQPPELVTMMAETAQKMYALYPTEHSSMDDAVG